MFDLMFDMYRKASESGLQMPLDLMKQWTQQWAPASSNVAGASTEWGRTFQKRWSDLLIESLNKHRESFDATYRSGIQLIEQTFRVSEAKSSDDYRRVTEDLWRKLLDILREQSETQLRDFQSLAAKSLEIQKSATANA